MEKKEEMMMHNPRIRRGINHPIGGLNGTAGYSACPLLSIQCLFLVALCLPTPIRIIRPRTAMIPHK